jgi:rubrerythrin
MRFLRRLLGGDKRLFECRHCGTTVSRGTVECPVCGHDGIAVYRLR